MFEIVRHFSAKTKILLIGIILVLIPLAVISYLSLQSVDQKAGNLKVNYTGTVRLVRDKLENEILRLEENLQNSVSNSDPKDIPQELKNWLSELELQNHVFKNLFLINSENGVLSSKLASHWNENRNENPYAKLLINANFKKAEEAEFRGKNIQLAILNYSKALSESQENPERARILSRLGRCYFKLENYDKGIVEYREMLDLNAGIAIGNTPAQAVALSQISFGHGEQGNEKEQVESNLKLYRFLIENPWDINEGEFQFYLKSVQTELQKQITSFQSTDSLLTELKTLNNKAIKIEDQIRFLKLIQKNIVSEINSDLNKENIMDIQTHKIISDGDGNAFQIGLFILPASFHSLGLQVLGYQFNDNYLLEKQIPQILASVELGNDFLLGILDNDGSLLYIQNDQVFPASLATEDFEVLFKNRKIALFHKDGKTLEQLVGKEKILYRILFGGVILLMLVGLAMIIRAMIHETEMARIKSEFVSNVSHELKTPLALIRMFGETLDSGIVTDEKKRKEFYGIIKTESERLTHLINNVLDFSKMDSGRKKYRFEETDLVQVVRNSLEAYKFHIRDNGFEIKSELPEEPIICSIDKDAVSQALLNLLSNAVKYSGTKKYIAVQVLKNENLATISVSDKGIGIPKNELKKIFEKFYRITNEKEQGSGGTGLGLTLTKQIIDAHGGNITAESEPGKGSCFTIKIPLSTSQTIKSN